MYHHDVRPPPTSEWGNPSLTRSATLLTPPCSKSPIRPSSSTAYGVGDRSPLHLLTHVGYTLVSLSTRLSLRVVPRPSISPFMRLPLKLESAPCLDDFQLLTSCSPWLTRSRTGPWSAFQLVR